MNTRTRMNWLEGFQGWRGLPLALRLSEGLDFKPAGVVARVKNYYFVPRVAYCDLISKHFSIEVV
jgi:hypothetical protein